MFIFQITVVSHDWGTAFGLHWCSEHRDRLEGKQYGAEGKRDFMDQSPH